jgi:hypothetical protein
MRGILGSMSTSRRRQDKQRRAAPKSFDFAVYPIRRFVATRGFKMREVS